MNRIHLRRIYGHLKKYRMVRWLRRWPKGVLVDGPLTYNEDGLATRHNADFLHSPRFKQAYLAGKATGSWGDGDIRWRAYVACWLAQRALMFEGDFVECGVNRGGLARTVVEYLGFGNVGRRFFLLDTYCGIPDESLSPEERALGVKWNYSECYDAVRTTFAAYENVVLIRGIVPHTLRHVDATKVAYLSLDMNCAQPEIAAARHFWPMMPSGAVILLDDYGWSGHTAQKRAFDRFAHDHGVEVLALPSGQGMIFKS
ncbi:MAG: TylF/MycF family methyltransferase [Gemmatimonadota bacterium]|nr:TylF/MycF family methyltransferase [Gemmatimonadota bacterium]